MVVSAKRRASKMCLFRSISTWQYYQSIKSYEPKLSDSQQWVYCCFNVIFTEAPTALVNNKMSQSIAVLSCIILCVVIKYYFVITIVLLCL